MSAVDRLAATLADHGMTARSYGWVCDCGITVTESPRRFEALPLHAAHLAAVIASSADLAVIELPKPDDDAEYGKVWRYDDVLGTVQVRPDGSIESRGDYEYEHTLAEMRACAGVAAAAVKAAEAVSDRG